MLYGETVRIWLGSMVFGCATYTMISQDDG